MKRFFFLVIVSFILALNVAGCTPMTKLEQSAVFETVLLENKGSLGQTFVAHYHGLQGIEIYLEPHEPGGGTINLQLNTGPMESQELASGSIPLNSISSPGFHQITFPPQKHSTQEYYYLVLEIQGSGNVKVGTAPGNTYINGALYRDHEPQDSQLSFNLMYQPAMLGLGLLKEGLTWIGYLLVAGFLFIIPGWALLSCLYPVWGEKDWASKLALSAGVSLALYPLLLLWTDVVGLHLGAIYAWVPPLFGVIAIILRNRTALNLETLRNIKKPRLDWPDVTLIFILGMIFAVRFWVIRTLEGPIGSDSLHHTIAAQLLLDNHGLMHSWQPYTALSTFTYHFGFHTASAVYTWFTNFSILKSVLQTGQILNGLAILALYPLAFRISKNKWSGVIAILLAGLLFPMPMYYINWGRYTQLASQVILPVLVVLLWDLFDSKKVHWSLIILSWITFSGLALTHYRILLFGIFFIPAYGFLNIQFIKSKKFILKILFVGIGSILLFTPWLYLILHGRLTYMVARRLSIFPGSISETSQVVRNLNYLNYLPGWAWLSLPVVIGWGFWKNKMSVAITGIWWFTALAAANPNWLNLPGYRILDHGTVITGFYIPTSLMIGLPIGLGIDKYYIIKEKLILLFTFLFIILIGSWGMLQRRQDVLPGAIQVTRSDIYAMSWISENTSQDSRFLVNSNTIFNTDWWYVGTDAGWWMPLLSQRETTTKQMAYGFENEVVPGARTSSNILNRLVIEKGLHNPEVISNLKDNHISHIYIGQQKNEILGNPASLITNDPNFIKVYQRDRACVFKIINIQH